MIDIWPIPYHLTVHSKEENKGELMQEHEANNKVHYGIIKG